MSKPCAKDCRVISIGMILNSRATKSNFALSQIEEVMELFTAILAFALVGGIARATVLFIQKPKEGRVSFTLFEAPETQADTYKKISIILQSLWAFYALTKTNEYESSLLSLDTLTILISLTLPISIFYLLIWLNLKAGWSIWMLILGSSAQLLAYNPLESVFNRSELGDTIILMVLAFNVFYLCANWPNIWNRFFDLYSKKHAAIKKGTVIVFLASFILVIAYSVWLDQNLVTSPPPEYFSKLAQERNDRSGMPMSAEEFLAAQTGNISNALNLIKAIQEKDIEPFLGKWESGGTVITIREEADYMLNISGTTVGPPRPYGPSTGEFEVNIQKSLFFSKELLLEDENCRIRIDIQQDHLIVSDNAQCGGLNAVFSGKLLKE